MSNAKDESRARVRELCETYYSGWREKYDLICKDYPEVVENWMRAHRSVSQGALTKLQKELVILGMELSMRHNNVEVHTYRAMEAGATPQQIAEVIGTCIMIHGMVTYVEGGARALKVAYRYQEDPVACKTEFDALRPGWDSGYTRNAPGGA